MLLLNKDSIEDYKENYHHNEKPNFFIHRIAFFA